MQALLQSTKMLFMLLLVSFIDHSVQLRMSDNLEVPLQTHLVRNVAEYQAKLLRDTEKFRRKPFACDSQALCNCTSRDKYGECTPWNIEERYYEHFRAVKTPRNHSYVYIPIFWLQVKHQRQQNTANAYLSSLDPRHIYYTIMKHAHGPGPRNRDFGIVIPEGLKVVVYESGGCDMCENVLKPIPLPLLMDELGPSGNHTQRDLDVVFQGSYKRHSVRRLLRRKFQDQYTFLDRSDDWQSVMERSNFTLCPRGYGETSYRLAEAIQLGSVPIYVWKGLKWLPYRELLSWDEFAIVLNVKKLKQMPEKVADAKRRLAAMQRRLQEVRHMFSYNFTCAYVEQTMAAMQL